MKKRRSTLILIILLPFIPVIMYATKIGKTLEYKTIDWRFRVRGESLVSENVFIAAMDDYSIDLIGRWPWRRGIIGSFINTLSVLPPQQMVLDILYTETSADFPIDDRLLAGASARNGRVYFPFLSLLGAPVFGIESLDDMLDPVKEIMLKSSLGKVEDYPEVDFIDAQTVLPPISQFAQVAKNSGYVNSEPDSDGVNRRIPLLMKMDGYIFPYLGLSAALDYLD
ncbi:MAG: CHASE2 domain-containing protein, partial [Elusimicrobia bacterium]|nr:CHASE2 domain-containing protein [Elusimicrobiota bacterium]